MNCPCGSPLDFKQCCGLYISGASLPETAEQLMRSRYTAYTQGEIGYIAKTLAPESRGDFDQDSARQWADEAEWMKLEILSTARGTAQDKKGTVEFVATYKQEGEVIEHHEVSQFRKNDRGQWFFVEGDSHTHKEGESHHHHHHRQETVVRGAPKVGRNDPCSCGSGKKFKKCCGAEGSPA